MPEYLAYSSLDELVTATFADCVNCGIDCLTKLALLEAAWKLSDPALTGDAFIVALDGQIADETVLVQLQQLTRSGLLSYDGSSYHLTKNPIHAELLCRLRSVCADRAMRARVAPLLRYRPA